MSSIHTILYIHISVYSARLSAVPTKTIKPFKTFLFFVKKETKKPDLCHLSKGGGCFRYHSKIKKIQEKSLVSLFNNRAQLQYKFNSRSSCYYLSELVL